LKATYVRWCDRWARSSFPLLTTKKRNAGIDVMTNTNERATAQVLGTSEYRTAQMFGLSLTAVFVGLLILNGISF
jgi:hypothetical protein